MGNNTCWKKNYFRYPAKYGHNQDCNWILKVDHKIINVFSIKIYNFKMFRQHQVLKLAWFLKASTLNGPKHARQRTSCMSQK